MRRKTLDVTLFTAVLLALGILAGCARKTTPMDSAMLEVRPTVVGAVVCLDIQEREPVEPAHSFPADVGTVWCWSKIKDGQGTTIKHVYYYENVEKGAVELTVGSPLWRTYSSKQVPSNWTGQWRVDIVDAYGNVLKSLDFVIGEDT